MSNAPQRWIPLESNPEVMNSWAEQAGLVISQDIFQDIYGLDPELLAFVPKPVKAVVLLFPGVGKIAEKRIEEDTKLKNGSLPLLPVDPTIVWIKQTIGNACGTMGLLHAIMNSSVTMAPESPLEKFIDICKNKTPEERAKILETTDLFTTIHADAANTGQTAVPTNLDTDFHFTCFVEAPGVVEGRATSTAGKRLIELDGVRIAPLDRGPCDGDFLEAVAAFVRSYYVTDADSANFSMIALAPPQED